MSTKKVVIEREKPEVTLNELKSDKGYAMIGNKGIYILVKNHNGLFSFVRVDKPALTSKPANEYGTAAGAIKEKIERGYEIVQYDVITDLFN